MKPPCCIGGFLLHLTLLKVKYILNKGGGKRLKITKEKLEKLYNSMTNKELCIELGVSMPTLSKMLKDSGIQRKGSGRTTKYRIV